MDGTNSLHPNTLYINQLPTSENQVHLILHRCNIRLIISNLETVSKYHYYICKYKKIC